jgi:hypothetical protein
MKPSSSKLDLRKTQAEGELVSVKIFWPASEPSMVLERIILE